MKTIWDNVSKALSLSNKHLLFLLMLVPWYFHYYHTTISTITSLTSPTTADRLGLSLHHSNSSGVPAPWTLSTTSCGQTATWTSVITQVLHHNVCTAFQRDMKGRKKELRCGVLKQPGFSGILQSSVGWIPWYKWWAWKWNRAKLWSVVNVMIRR